MAARQLAVGHIEGIDNAPSMLTAARAYESSNVTFRDGDLSTWRATTPVDLVLAAASLQWVPDHAAVLASWKESLAPGGQLAVQVPANAHAPTHVIATELANEEPYLSAFGAVGPPHDPVHENVLRPDEYARILRDLGCSDQRVFLRVYPHELENVDAVVSWVRGTTLTRFARALPPEAFEEFVRDYTLRLRRHYRDVAPVFFPFSRILFWGQLPD